MAHDYLLGGEGLATLQALGEQINGEQRSVTLADLESFAAPAGL
ncbi:hypothetical protein ACH4SK_18640 [Streptomyces inhibens]